MKFMLYSIGPALGIVGCTALIVSAFFREPLLSWMRRLRPLSPTAQMQLDELGKVFEPSVLASRLRTIPLLDIFAVYWNSKENCRIANQANVDRTRPDCELFLNRITADHAKICRYAWQSVRERIIGKLRNRKTVYTGDLLWTYAEEQELLAHLAECCDPKQGHVISLRL